MTDKPGREGAIDEIVEDLMEDPDSPDKGNDVPPPQTVKAEPTSAPEPSPSR